MRLPGAIAKLEGFEAPAVEWEKSIFPSRIANYDPRWLDQLCLSGAVGWGRVSPHPAWSAGDGAAPRRVIPTNAAPITFYVRETADWLPHALAQQSVDEQLLAAALSPDALRIRALLQQRGACFANDLQRITGLSRAETSRALWELATAGLAAADGFDQLRALMDPRRKPSNNEALGRRPSRTTAGRWSLLNEQQLAAEVDPIAAARRTDAALESFARMLLARVLGFPALREVPGMRKSGPGAAVPVDSVPAAMIPVQMGVDDDVDRIRVWYLRRDPQTHSLPFARVMTDAASSLDQDALTPTIDNQTVKPGFDPVQLIGGLMFRP